AAGRFELAWLGRRRFCVGSVDERGLRLGKERIEEMAPLVTGEDPVVGVADERRRARRVRATKPDRPELVEPNASAAGAAEGGRRADPPMPRVLVGGPRIEDETLGTLTRELARDGAGVHVGFGRPDPDHG